MGDGSAMESSGPTRWAERCRVFREETGVALPSGGSICKLHGAHFQMDSPFFCFCFSELSHFSRLLSRSARQGIRFRMFFATKVVSTRGELALFGPGCQVFWT